MKCIDPVLCYATQGGKKLVYRNFSLVHPMRLRFPHRVFNCGKCINCRKRNSRELAVRCVLHASLYDRNCFLTLTYDESKDGYHNDFNYRDIQLFKKNLRQKVWREQKKRIEVFNVHEYGKNGKKHWHLIVFNHDFDDKRLHTVRNGLPLYTSEELGKIWTFGFNSIGDVSEASAMYQAQYTQKDLKYGNATNKKRSHSKHSGIGRPYFFRNYKQILMLGFIPVGGHKVPVPRYFQKLAHKHYCHFYDKSAFFDTRDRKALYRPFKKEEPNKEIADLYADFKQRKEILIGEMENEWQDVISSHLISGEEPDFVKSGSNLLYDLANKQQKGDF